MGKKGMKAGLSRVAGSMAALVLACTALAPQAMAAGGGYLEQTFRVTGRWEEGHLVAERVQLREPQADARRGQVSGRIDGVDQEARRFSVGLVQVGWDASTRFEGLVASELAAGQGAAVSGDWRGGVFHATTVRRADPAVTQVTGVVTAVEVLPDGAREVRLLELPVRMHQAGYNAAEALGRRQDSRRPDRQAEVTIAGQTITIGGEVALEGRQRGNRSLEDNDRVDDTEATLKLEAATSFTDRVHAFASVAGVFEGEREDGARTGRFAVERDQMWVYLERIGGTGFGLQLGRQNFRETRQWWWDDDLDAVRAYYDAGAFHGELGVARELAAVSTLDDGIDPERQGVTHVLGTASWMWAPRQKLELFFLHANDGSATQALGAVVDPDREDAADARLTWVGLRAIGRREFEGRGRLSYWADTARVRGRERRLSFTDAPGGNLVDGVRDLRVQGHAFDVGASWEAPWSVRPTFTLSLARGSGDREAGDGVDGGFRQTGLHKNKWRWSGVNRFRMYGEALRPDLTNLGVVTASVGLPLRTNSSVELAWHRYTRLQSGGALGELSLRTDPTATSNALGDGIDLVLGIRDLANIDFELVAGGFRAGEAFGSQEGQWSYSVSAEVKVNF